MGQVVRGPWKSPTAKEKLEREIAVLRELIEAYKAERAKEKGGAVKMPRPLLTSAASIPYRHLSGETRRSGHRREAR